MKHVLRKEVRKMKMCMADKIPHAIRLIRGFAVTSLRSHDRTVHSVIYIRNYMMGEMTASSDGMAASITRSKHL